MSQLPAFNLIKRVLALLLLLVMCHASIAQKTSSGTYLSFKSGLLSVKNQLPTMYYGLDLDIGLGGRLRIHYSIMFGDGYFHMPLGPVGGLFALASSDAELDEPPLELLFFLLLIPEGIGIEFPIREKFSFTPYISPLQFDFIENDRNGSSDKRRLRDWGYGAIGIKANVFLKNKFRIAPYGEYKIHYDQNLNPGWSIGINIGWKF